MLAIPKKKSSLKVKQVINELNRADLSKVSLSHLKNQIRFLFESYIHTSLRVPVGWGKLYRAIPYSKIPTETNKLSYPPTEKRKLNRANFEGNPIFYCSGDPRAAFFESRVNVRDTVVISKWTPISEMLLFPLGYTSEIFNNLDANRNCPNIIPEKERHPQELKPPNIYIKEYLDEVFASDSEYQYKLTAAIAEEFLITQPECGIVYPAIRMRGNTENFALTSHLVDRSLKLESAAWFRIDGVKDFQYTVTLLKCAEFENPSLDVIEWNHPTINNKQFWSNLLN